jgi:hypothetical protein
MPDAADDASPSTAGIMCRVTSPLTRRTVLRGGLAVTAGTVALSAISACDRGPTADQITAAALVPLAQAALADQAAAQSLAPRTPDYTNALGVVASQRGEHARALREEITRLDQETADRIGTPAGQPGTSGGASAPTPPPSTGPVSTIPEVTSVTDLRGRLSRSARTAGDAAGALGGYAAGLAGAVSASVTSMVEVQLG